LVGENGLVVFIEEEGAKVRVMRDRRRKEDLLQVRSESGREAEREG